MSNYKNGFVATGKTHFVKTPVVDVEHSKQVVYPRLDTTFNAGDLIPVYCNEVLPGDTFSMDIESVVRLSTLKVPFSGELYLDIYAFFVPNRVVNESWKNVQGENTSGYWVAPEVSLCPLYSLKKSSAVAVPVGSVADYYGFPTQGSIPASVLHQCNDLKFRGYLEIYNNYFRDQNYQPPIPYSKLNVYNGFFESLGSTINYSGSTGDVYSSGSADGSYPDGAIVKAVAGSGSDIPTITTQSFPTSWSALDAPLKANKMHDYFTSGLPSPQKGPEVVMSLSGQLPVTFGFNPEPNYYQGDYMKLLLSSDITGGSAYTLGIAASPRMSEDQGITRDATVRANTYGGGDDDINLGVLVKGTNLSGEVDLTGVGLSIDELRMSSAVQRVYETLARGGSRYIEYIASMFGIETENPFKDIPTRLGHIRLSLDMYQTAQTSASQEGNTPQGNLTAYSYTDKNGHLFTHTFLEHGYVHCLAVVRHKNVYTSFMARDNFRLNAIDFYQPPLANISEQPVYSREINPFGTNANGGFCYQEAWAEYRYEPDRVSAYARSGISESLSLWNLSDEFDSSLNYSNGDWLKSNTQQILDRSLAVSSSIAHQIKGFFQFKIVKDRPLPVYSIPGMDVI